MEYVIIAVVAIIAISLFLSNRKLKEEVKKTDHKLLEQIGLAGSRGDKLEAIEQKHIEELRKNELRIKELESELRNRVRADNVDAEQTTATIVDQIKVLNDLFSVANAIRSRVQIINARNELIGLCDEADLVGKDIELDLDHVENRLKNYEGDWHCLFTK